jgi:ABC-2 type transport system permease protein
MNKSMLVARREYLSTVSRKGFIVATIGMPLFFLVLYGIIGGATYLSMRQQKEKAENVGIVDESGLVRFGLLAKVGNTEAQKASAEAEVPSEFRNRGRQELARLAGVVQIKAFKTRAEAGEAFQRKEIRGYYIIPSDFLQNGVVQLEIKKGAFMSDNEPGWNSVKRLIAASLVEGKLDEAPARRVWTPPALKSQALAENGQPDKRGEFSEVSSFVVPYVFTLLFLLSIMSSAGYLLQGVAEEKENRVIEILLSSVTPNQLLAGKVIGLCGAGLTQIAVWISIVIIPSVFLLPFLDLRWGQLVVALVFFPLGFVLFGTLMAGSGALGNNIKESQQLSIVWSMSSVIPMFFISVILSQPNGTFARVLSYIPLTAPITIMMRVGATQVPWWDITLSAVILFASLFVFIRLAAKMFRLGTLMYGKRPSVVEIIRWLKAA